MGRIIEFIQQRQQEFGVWIQFSTLSEYFTQAAMEGQFPSLQGDFMPYADNEQSYWTVRSTMRRRTHTVCSPQSVTLSLTCCRSSCPGCVLVVLCAGLLHHQAAIEGQIENVSAVNLKARDSIYNRNSCIVSCADVVCVSVAVQSWFATAQR
jgi:hypothetical protein